MVHNTVGEPTECAYYHECKRCHEWVCKGEWHDEAQCESQQLHASAGCVKFLAQVISCSDTALREMPKTLHTHDNNRYFVDTLNIQCYNLLKGNTILCKHHTNILTQ